MADPFFTAWRIIKSPKAKGCDCDKGECDCKECPKCGASMNKMGCTKMGCS